MASIFRSPDARRAVLDQQQRFLDRWPTETATTTVATREGDTFVATCGPADAPPLVLLHGAGFNSASWTPDVHLWSITHRIVAIDVIGEPGRSAESRPAFETDAYTLWLDDVLDGLDVTATSLVGASLGGWLALDYAIRRPDRVDALATLVPAGIGRQRLLPLLALVFVPFGRRGRGMAADFVLGPRPDPPVTLEQAALRQEMGDYLLLIQTSYRPRRTTLPAFSDDQLSNLSMPLCVIAGADDRLISTQDTQQRLAELLPGASVHIRPNTGHIPTDYAEDILQFLVDTESR